MIDSIFTSKKIFFHANILSYYIEIVNILNNILKYSSMLTENKSLKDSLHFDKVWIRDPDPDWDFRLDPDPDSTNTDPKHCMWE